MLKMNYHTHTVYCDGRDTPEAVAEEALAKGFLCLGFSGHMDPEIHMDLAAYTQEIRRLQEKYRGRLEILLGVETDTMYDPAGLKGFEEQIEYRIGSTHFIPGTEAAGKKQYLEASPELIPVDAEMELLQQGCKGFFSGDYYRMSRAYYETVLRTVERTDCSFIGHFDLITRFNDSFHFLEETDPRYLNPAREVLEQLVSRGIPFEINCGAVNRGRKRELYPHPLLLKALRDFGGEILINADAHQKELLDGGFSRAMEEAIRAGFTHICVLTRENTGHRASGGTDARPLYWKQLALDSLLRDT